MKLAEALVERKAAQEKLDQLGYRLKRSIFKQEGEQPLEAPQDLLAEIEQVAQQLEALIIAINLTNSQTVLDSGATITATIAQRDMLLKRISILDMVLAETNQVHYRVRGSEIKLLPTMDIPQLQKSRDFLAKQHRELDTKLQAANWTADLIEN